MKQFFFLFVMFFLLAGCTSSWRNVYTHTSTTSISYGVRLVELKQYREALHIYLAFADKESDPKIKAGIYNNIAIIHEALGETENARAWYKKALELYPDKDIYDNYRRFTGDE